MSNNFYVGQEVVCVEDGDDVHWLNGKNYFGTLDGLRKGAIYTVRRTDIEPIWVILLFGLRKLFGLSLMDIQRLAFMRSASVP